MMSFMLYDPVVVVVVVIEFEGCTGESLIDLKILMVSKMNLISVLMLLG